jgi:hypothetical protein
MVCFQTKNPNLGEFGRALDWKMFIYVFYGHLEYFVEIWDILWPFGIFCIHLVHFFGFGIVYQEKSGNPGPNCRQTAIKRFKIIFPITSSFVKNMDQIFFEARYGSLEN